MPARSKAKSPLVDRYLARVPPKFRPLLARLRRLIREEVPDAEEVISYGMPAFRRNGNLVFYAAFKDHCSFFPGSVATLRQFASEVTPFDTGKGTLHFTVERPLPDDLVRRIVRARTAENAEREARRRR
jgi:uncharacterized protein YdhG (YjbR/CyaY superfamily)